jgi:hypothetical protein
MADVLTELLDIPEESGRDHYAQTINVDTTSLDGDSDGFDVKSRDKEMDTLSLADVFLKGDGGGK